jgi:hypothetical protein
MKKKLKTKLLKRYADNLKCFYPDLNDYFICPTCFSKIPIKETGSISEAHIIPKAAGGSFKTFLCCKCNSLFGSHQDKWFGEFIKINGASGFLMDDHNILYLCSPEA